MMMVEKEKEQDILKLIASLLGVGFVGHLFYTLIQIINLFII